VRQHAGGLAATGLTAGSSTAFVTELLYNRLYSLMWSQGTRWIDARRYNRLDTLPIDRPGDTRYHEHDHAGRRVRRAQPALAVHAAVVSGQDRRRRMSRITSGTDARSRLASATQS
jgi:hypothetical protein